MPRILLIEDDARTASLVVDYLQTKGFTVDVQPEGTGAAERIVAERPDLVLLDWMLPGEDGPTICRKVREAYDGPILMLTARSDDIDQIVGLEVGADDYVAKPANPRVLLARITSLLRRVQSSGRGAGQVERRVVLGDLVVDLSLRAASIAGSAVPLTTAEFDLLWLLATRAGQPVDRDALFEGLRGIPYDGLDRSMDMRVSTVRRALTEADPQGRDWFVTVRGVGYQLVKR